MYDDIVIPTDGSRGAERGVEHGLELADRFDAAIHSLYVVDENVHDETPALSAGELRYETLESPGEDIVDEVVTRAENRGLDADGQVARGVPWQEIADYAAAEGADLIVMGRHGEHPDPPHIGHVTDRVIRAVDIPVFPV